MNKKILACLLIIFAVSSIAYAQTKPEEMTDAGESGIPVDPNAKPEKPETVSIDAIDPDYAPWTIAGAAGIVDESDTGIVDLYVPAVRVYPFLPTTKLPATLNMYYNVEAVDGLTDGKSLIMNMRYVDNGADARVIARLYEINQNTGVINTRIYIDSNDYAQSPYVQSKGKSLCTVSVLDFRNNVYLIEAVLTKQTTAGTPVLVGIKLDTEPC